MMKIIWKCRLLRVREEVLWFIITGSVDVARIYMFQVSSFTRSTSDNGCQASYCQLA